MLSRKLSTKLSKKNHTQILSIETIAKTKVFEVQAVDLRFSNGEQRTYERLKPGKREAVMVVPIDKENQSILLIQEYSVGTERYELGFVKGLMDPDETPEQSANRELQEEIGFKANKLTLLRSVNTSPGYMNNMMHIFLAEDLTPSQLTGDEPEPLDIVSYPLASIETLLHHPDFCEARNLTALYLLRDLMK